MIKRTFDTVLAFLALCFIGPFVLLVALAIIVTDGRPVFFSQTRVGLGGKPFNLRKFRTMKVNAGGPPLTVAEDTRVTPIGRWLRKYKLDELPQLYNILFGEMSFVGPRPEVPKYVALFPEEYAEILSVRPGITDPASIKFRDEAAILSSANNEAIYIQTILPTKIAVSLEYARNQSLVKDIALIFQTISAVFFTSGRNHR